MKSTKKGIGILGGTFNPVHIGHLRLALEVGEAMNLERVLLSPSAIPPHKDNQGILPFALRAALLKEAVRNFPSLGLSTLEGEMQGPSYTFSVMEEWRKRNPETKPWFMLGAEDFALLDTWYRGLDLPSLVNLIVVPRAGADHALFLASVKRFWPYDSQHLRPGDDNREEISLGDWGLLAFFPVPRLDISSSFIRQRWLQGREVGALVPHGVLNLLTNNRTEVEHLWREAPSYCTQAVGSGLRASKAD